MEQNPFGQEKNNKINSVREEVKNEMEDLFNSTPEKRKIRIDDFIYTLGIYQESGLVFDKEKVEKELLESINIKEKELFISNLLKILEPFIITRATQPEIVDIIKKIKMKDVKKYREAIINEDGNIKLSEILYAGLSEKSAHIHLADAYDYMTKEKIADFDLEIKKGLKNLAKLIEPMKNIEKITATSWIVATSPKRLEKLGFTIEGEISEEEKNEHYKDDHRKIFKVSMDRKKFDELYLDKENLT